MNTTLYPLGHDTSELARLDLQAVLLRDPLLESFAASAENCLEIGCGNGSNLSILRSANPAIQYTGIDIMDDAISAARHRFSGIANTEFHVMDASSPNLEKGSFDLVFTKLVLWSVGPSWKSVLEQALALLKPGGVFYALEPVNQLIEIFPEKPSFKTWVKHWDQAAINRGLNPHIGSEVATAMKSVGFKQVDAKFFPVIATAYETERYNAIVENFKGFLMGASEESFNLQYNESIELLETFESTSKSIEALESSLKRRALAELFEVNSESVVMDALYVSWGVKPA